MIGHGLPESAYPLLTTGATGLPRRAIDTRIPNAAAPATARTRSAARTCRTISTPQARCTASTRCGSRSIARRRTPRRPIPSGCLDRPVPVGRDQRRRRQQRQARSRPASTTRRPAKAPPSMGFYNVAQRRRAATSSSSPTTTRSSDNFHQPVDGRHRAPTTSCSAPATRMYFSDGNGNAAVPPANQIENPDPQPGTNNYYTQDGYSGGTYSDCADATQPGVAAVADYLAALPYRSAPNCDAGHLLPAEQLQPGLSRRRLGATRRGSRVPPSRRCRPSATMLMNGAGVSLGLLRRRLERLRRSAANVAARRATATSAIRSCTRPRS